MLSAAGVNCGSTRVNCGSKREPEDESLALGARARRSIARRDVGDALHRTIGLAPRKQTAEEAILGLGLGHGRRRQAQGACKSRAGKKDLHTPIAGHCRHPSRRLDLHPSESLCLCIDEIVADAEGFHAIG